MVRFALKIDHLTRYAQNIVFKPGVSKWWPNWAKLRIKTEKIKIGLRKITQEQFANLCRASDTEPAVEEAVGLDTSFYVHL